MPLWPRQIACWDCLCGACRYPPARARLDSTLTQHSPHTGPIIEYGCVIWAGAAVTQLRRLERLQHRFLMWLASKTTLTCPPLDYGTLTSLFGCGSVKSRLVQTDLSFMRSVLGGDVDCHQIVGMFPLSAPGRRTRHSELFSCASSKRSSGNREEGIASSPAPVT